MREHASTSDTAGTRDVPMEIKIKLNFTTNKPVYRVGDIHCSEWRDGYVTHWKINGQTLKPGRRYRRFVGW